MSSRRDGLSISVIPSPVGRPGPHRPPRTTTRWARSAAHDAPVGLAGMPKHRNFGRIRQGMEVKHAGASRPEP